MSAKRPTPSIPVVTDLHQLPLVCDITHFCGATGRKYWTVRKTLSAGTCVPVPAFEHPYRWHRDDIEAYLASKSLVSRAKKGRAA